MTMVSAASLQLPHCVLPQHSLAVSTDAKASVSGCRSFCRHSQTPASAETSTDTDELLNVGTTLYRRSSTPQRRQKVGRWGGVKPSTGMRIRNPLAPLRTRFAVAPCICRVTHATTYRARRVIQQQRGALDHHRRRRNACSPATCHPVPLIYPVRDRFSPSAPLMNRYETSS